jgi:hypothetical protein
MSTRYYRPDIPAARMLDFMRRDWLFPWPFIRRGNAVFLGWWARDSVGRMLLTGPGRRSATPPSPTCWAPTVGWLFKLALRATLWRLIEKMSFNKEQNERKTGMCPRLDAGQF